MPCMKYCNRSRRWSVLSRSVKAWIVDTKQSSWHKRYCFKREPAHVLEVPWLLLKLSDIAVFCYTMELSSWIQTCIVHLHFPWLERFPTVSYCLKRSMSNPWITTKVKNAKVQRNFHCLFRERIAYRWQSTDFKRQESARRWTRLTTLING